MNDINIENLKYPVGKFKLPSNCDDTYRATCIAALKELPAKIRLASQGMTDEQLDTPYREGGWTSRQIIHHLADSHMNSFIRFKLAINEDNPTIKPYEQDDWAVNPDAKISIDSSLSILDGVHARLVELMNNMKEKDFGRTLYHPEMSRELNLDFMAGLYSWHSKHHTEQIVQLRQRKGW